MAERAPGARRPRRDEYAAGVLESAGAGQARCLGHTDALEADIGLPDRAGGTLADHRHRLEPRHVLLDEEALDLAVLVRPGPHDDDVGDRAVADPALGAVEHPVVAVPARAGLERDGVRAVCRLGQREGADLLEPSQRREPALLLLLGPEQIDRFHRQPGLDAEEGTEAAVAAMDLHVDQPAGERAHAGTAIARDVLAEQAELGKPMHEGPGQLCGLPVVVDRRQHLLVDEAAHLDEMPPLLVGELLADQEVVRRERLSEVLVGNRRRGHRSLLSSRGRSCPAPWRPACACGCRAWPGAPFNSPERARSHST